MANASGTVAQWTKWETALMVRRVSLAGGLQERALTAGLGSYKLETKDDANVLAILKRRWPDCSHWCCVRDVMHVSPWLATKTKAPGEVLLHRGHLYSAPHWIARHINVIVSTSVARACSHPVDVSRFRPHELALARKFAEWVGKLKPEGAVGDAGWIPPKVARPIALFPGVPFVNGMPDLRKSSLVPACMAAVQNPDATMKLDNLLRIAYGRVMRDLGIPVDALVQHWDRRLARIYGRNPQELSAKKNGYKSAFRGCTTNPEMGLGVSCGAMMEAKLCPHATEHGERKARSICFMNTAGGTVEVKNPATYVRRHIEMMYDHQAKLNGHPPAKKPCP
jgi:hypothetical protein